MLKKLLIPLDGTEVTSEVLQYTQALADQADATVTLLHVAADAEANNGSSPQDHPCLAAVFRALQERGWRVDARIGSGDPAAGILATASDITASLILISTHGRSGLDLIREGSVTETVLRESKCPLFILHSTRPGSGTGLGDASEGSPFKRMLVPLDGSDESAAILPCVEQFARLHGAEIILFHDSAGDSDQASDGVKAAHIRAMLEQHSVRLANTGLRVRLDWTSYRHPIREILNSIDSLCIDVVAMTTHTCAGRDQPPQESVTADIIRHAECPLLVWACAHCSQQGMP